VGSGAIGTVFRDERLDLVVKVAHDDEEAIQCIADEALVYDRLKTLCNLPVPHYYGHFTSEGIHVLLLEWCGQPLAVDSLEDLSQEQRLVPSDMQHIHPDLI
jgi:hypothetical protein